MAKFKQNIVLSDEEKQFVVKYLKPFLEKNDLKAIRIILNAKSGRATKHEYPDIPILYGHSPWTIRWWLLQQLGEDIYFKDSVAIFPAEFYEAPITEITIPKNIEFIQDVAFNQAELSHIKLNEGLKYIANAVFAGTRLKSITFPASLESISLHTFAGCDNLVNVTLSGNQNIKVYSSTFESDKKYKLSIPKDKRIYVVDKQQVYDKTSTISDEDFSNNIIIRY